MKPYSVHGEAAIEAKEAILRYESEKKGLGRKLRAAFSDAIRTIRFQPQAFPCFDERGTRFYVLRRYSFAIYYVELPKRIWILAFAHTARRPGYWKHRQPPP